MNLFSQSIPTEFARTIGNGLYSILLGLAVSTVFTSGALAWWPNVLYFLYLALALYFVIDWLSFNALLQNATGGMRHGWLLANIIAILAFGSALNFCPRLVNATGQLGSETTWALDLFELFLIAYIILTTVGTFKSIGHRTSWQRWDFVFRGYLAAVIIILALFRRAAQPEFAPEANEVLFAYLLLIAILLAGKVVRYEKDLLDKSLCTKVDGK